MPTTFTTLDDLRSAAGQHLGWTDWIEIDQARVNQFADATGDHQWIHVDVDRANAESPFGGPIAHGYLTLALSNLFLPQLISVPSTSMVMVTVVCSPFGMSSTAVISAPPRTRLPTGTGAGKRTRPVP